ncbi:MAG TPA: shikimate dehydrogenase [Pirellulales bacterium]|jgi:3-dehydroquinate dehydratase/shikimate dehydrogenase|nr:shikimate dehydrogenase [Pirellulales bacterium]
MICVSIGRGRHRHVIAEHKHLVEKGAQLVELRLDYINGQVNLKRLLVDRPGPVIVTLRRPQDGGKYAGTEDERRILLRTAIADGVDYVDLEEDVATAIPRYGKTKRIISLHDFRKTPEDLDEIHARLAGLDPDIIKISTLANHPHDNTRMLRLVRGSKVPTVGICMGDIGTPSRLLVGRCGAPFSYATFHHERALAPGQLSFEQMKDTYHYDQVNAETEVYGVIGDPIGQSLSPLIHNAAFRHLGLNKVYLAFRIPRDDLPSFLDDAPELGIKGLSVTIPHKEAVLRRISQVDGAVRGVGAANTILFEPGLISGHNTDYRAAMDSIQTALAEGSDERADLASKVALVLGAGGAAKAIAFGLQRRGAEVVVASRTRERADKLAEALGAKAVDWGTRHNFWVDVLVNCTPVGMHPNVDETPYDKHYLKPSMVVFDTVYNPESTLLVKDARARSCTVITGVEMFIRQAALQFKLFTGQEAPFELMRDVLKRAIGPARY